MYPIIMLNPDAVFQNGIGGFFLRHDLQKWVDEHLLHQPVVVHSEDGQYRVVFGSVEEATLFRLRWGYG